MMIHATVVQASYVHSVRKLLYLGSSCIYPRDAHQPMTEEALLTGPLEPTNEPYAIAKIAGIKLCQSYRAQYGANFISAMPTNLYGPYDNFDLTSSHVLPALDAQVPRRLDQRRTRRRDLGHRQTAPRVPPRRRSRRRVSLPHGQLHGRQPHQRRHGRRSQHPRARGSSSATWCIPKLSCASTRASPMGRLASCSTWVASTGSDGRRRSSSARVSSRPTRGSSNTSARGHVTSRITKWGKASPGTSSCRRR